MSSWLSRCTPSLRQPTNTATQLDDVASVELENVTGGCAACGNAACCTTPGVGPGVRPGIDARRFGWR